MYRVVFRNTSGSVSTGTITWSSFTDKQAFKEWYNQKMQAWYEVMEEDVTEERAIKLCSTPEATHAVLVSGLREIDELLSQI